MQNNKGAVHMNQENNQEHALIPPKCQEMSRNCEKVYIFEYITIFIFVIFGTQIRLKHTKTYFFYPKYVMF